MLRLKVRSFIRYVKNKEGGPFLILRFKVRPEIIFRITYRTIPYATFRGPPFIRYIRNTEGGPFLMLRFEVRPDILDMLEIQRADHFLCYVFGSALSLDMLEIQMADQFLCYDLRSVLSF